MKHKYSVIVGILAAVLLLLPGMAHGETIRLDEYVWNIGMGDTLDVELPDLSALVPGKNLTRDQYTVEYSSPHCKYVTISEETGISVDAAMASDPDFGYSKPVPISIFAIYTPKNGTEADAQWFAMKLNIYGSLQQLTASPDGFCMGESETVNVYISQPRDSYAEGLTWTDSAGILEVTKSSNVDSDQNGILHTLQVKAKAQGKTNLTVTAYNGVSVTVPVEVAKDPEAITFAQERYFCYQGDTVQLDVEVGEGCAMYKPANVTMQGYGLFAEGGDWRTYRASGVGDYVITVESANGVKGQVMVTVYSTKTTMDFDIDRAIYHPGDEILLYSRDHDRFFNYVPLKVTRGEELVTLQNQHIPKLIALKEGVVEITAYSKDGSTVSYTLEIAQKPRKIALNIENPLVLEVGDTLELIPTFDKGKAACDFHVYDDESNADNYGMDSVRCDGNMLYAQAPGSATLIMYVDAYEHSEYRVIVSDGDKAIRLVHPEGPLGVQKTFQLKVEDRTGKEYPAVFSQQQGTEGIAIVSENGLMTGVAPGEFILYATLEDGRKMQYRQKVLQVPEWLQHDDAMACINWQDARLMPIQSDVGIIPADQVNVTVADESIATYNGAFRFHKEGTTTVTLTSKYSDASITFTLTVLPPDGTLYTDETWLKVPMDSFVYLPEVRDYYGNKVEVTWEITYHVAGSGNPNSTAFRLTPTRIFCSWPYGLCEITGTAQDGRYIVLTASGYRMAKSIRFRQSTQEIYVGEQAQLQLTISEMGYELGPVTWKVGDSSILQFAEKDPATGETAVTGLKAGTTTVKATLQNGTTATCTITVKPPVPVEAFYFEPAEVTIYEGVDYFFIPLHEPKNTTESLLKTWSTSNPEVATIEQGTARLRGVKPGEAVITATLESGKSASLKVKVVGKKALYLPYDLTAVEEEAFAGGGFTHVYCRTGLVSIGSRAFADCKDLKCIWIPDSVKFISPDAFAGCSDVKIMCLSDSYAYRFAQSHYMLWELTSRFD